MVFLPKKKKKSAGITLVLIRDVVLRFSANQERGEEERLVQLILQVDVVVAWTEGRAEKYKIDTRW